MFVGHSSGTFHRLRLLTGVNSAANLWAPLIPPTICCKTWPASQSCLAVGLQCHPSCLLSGRQTALPSLRKEPEGAKPWCSNCNRSTRCAAMGKGHGAAACLLQTLLLPLCLAEEGQEAETFGKVQCLNNYGYQTLSWVNCTWHPNRHPGQGPFYLHFHDPDLPQNNLACWLPTPTEIPGESSCSMTREREFNLNDIYHVSLRDASLGKNVTHNISTYEPSQHIRCDPPSDLQSNMSTSKCRLQWKRPAAFDLIDSFQWDLAFKATTALWEEAQNRSFSSRETWIELEGSEFEPGVNYLARLRCKISDVKYGSEWSVWSTPTEWAAPPGPPSWQPAVPPSWALLISLPLCLSALLFLLLGLWVFSRNKGDGYGCIHTPTPAMFFQPLYTSHNGNFQHWVGLKEANGWLKTSHSSPPDKAVAVGCQFLETISPVSIFQQLTEAEAVSQGRDLLPLPTASDWPYVGSKYVVLEGEQQVHEAEAQPLFSGGSLHLQGSAAGAQPGCPHMSCNGTESPQLAPCLGKEHFCHCSEEDYCILGASSSSQHDSMATGWQERPDRVEGGLPQAAQTTTDQA